MYMKGLTPINPEEKNVIKEVDKNVSSMWFGIVLIIFGAIVLPIEPVLGIIFVGLGLAIVEIIKFKNKGEEK